MDYTLDDQHAPTKAESRPFAVTGFLLYAGHSGADLEGVVNQDCVVAMSSFQHPPIELTPAFFTKSVLIFSPTPKTAQH